MTYAELALHLFLLAMCVTLCGLWFYERGLARGWQDGFFDRIRRDRDNRDNFGRFRAKDAPRHTL